MKQGISEFYLVEMPEKSWDGFAVHTEAGFNAGKVCYGVTAHLVSSIGHDHSGNQALRMI